jgi:hypothetical protein
MGNVLSEEAEPTFLEEGFNLDSPHADKEINYGTAAPVWQNKKSVESEEETASKENIGTEGDSDAFAANEKLVQSLTEPPPQQAGTEILSNGEKFASKNRQDSSVSESGHSVGSQDNQKKPVRQNSTSSNSASDSQSQKKMSYVQMVKMGYQELVNAIIRPPRCDYRVS